MATPVKASNGTAVESKYITVQTRITWLVRRTLCFSTTERMPDLVLGLFIKGYAFGQPL